MSCEADQCNFNTMKSHTEKASDSSATFTSWSSRYSMMASKNPRRIERRQILDITIDKRKKKTGQDQANLYRSTLIKIILKRVQDDIEEEKKETKKSYNKYFSINNRGILKKTDQCDLDAHSTTTSNPRSAQYSTMASKNLRRMERRKILDISIDKRKKKTKQDQANLYRSTLIKIILKRLQDDIEEEKTEMKKSYAKYFNINNRGILKGISEINQSVSND